MFKNSAKSRNTISSQKGRCPMNFGAAAKGHGVYSFEAFAPCPVSRPSALRDAISALPVGVSDLDLKSIGHWLRSLGVLSYKHAQMLLPLVPHLPQMVDLRVNRLWIAEAHNIHVNEGLDDILDKYWKGSAYTAAHYLGLADGTPTVAAGDTMASHAGWVEVTGYDEAARQTITFGTVASQSVDNSSSKAVITASGAITVGGGFAATDSTKGGSGGTLVSVSAFSGGDESLTAAETLTMTFTATQADDGV